MINFFVDGQMRYKTSVTEWFAGFRLLYSTIERTHWTRRERKPTRISTGTQHFSLTNTTIG